MRRKADLEGKDLLIVDSGDLHDGAGLSDADPKVDAHTSNEFHSMVKVRPWRTFLFLDRDCLSASPTNSSFPFLIPSMIFSRSEITSFTSMPTL